ncbi:ABC transporter ATP-binding protein [Bulleidia sp. HCP3S3_F2]|jgi:ATP-binding cassette subfamily B multidrug efflux pump|uniref:ABC transporter ATP-binding protein n=1 Tax=unclassified Bulleidia TaxID=2704656 RepID=UPI003F8BB08D
MPRGQMRPVKKVKKGTFTRVVKYMFQDYMPQMILVVACIFISVFCTLQGTLFQKTLIDSYILPMLKSGSTDFTPLASAILKLIGILSVGILASFLYNRIMVTVSQGTMEKMREEIFSHMETLPIRYFDTHSHGDIMSVYTNDVDTMRQVISQTIPNVISSSITIISSFVSMILLSIPLTLVSLMMIGLMMIVVMKIGGKSSKYFMEQQKSLGQLNGYVEEMIQGVKVVKVFCHEKESVEGFEKNNEQLRVSANNANKFANIMMPIMGNLGNISYVLIAVVGAGLSLSGLTGLTLGTLVSFLTLNKNFTMPVTQISQQVNAVAAAMAGAERIFDLLDEKSEDDDGYVTLVNAVEDADGTLHEADHRTGVWAWKHPHQADGTITYRKLEGKITMDDVDFSYDGKKTVLHNVTLYGMPGEKIAFVGSTGAGKTTITNLINRFYDIEDGKIRYDDININKIKKSSLRRSLGIVLQDTHLFTGTIMDNIRYGRLDATDEECIAAAKLANADGFIRRLPNGYQTEINSDGGTLSQGERQLLSIARAAVADAPAMILDEATSSIDTRTESLVQKGMDALMNGRTTFVIAHRLSTVQNSDCIMVLENGRIIERGNHDELIAKKGRYYQLYTGNAIGEE